MVDEQLREILIDDVIVDPQVRTEFEPTPLHELAASLSLLPRFQATPRIPPINMAIMIHCHERVF